jgi:hypothetical protein
MKKENKLSTILGETPLSQLIGMEVALLAIATKTVSYLLMMMSVLLHRSLR